MSPSWWRKLVAKRHARNSNLRDVPNAVGPLARLELELLEDRFAPAIYQWTGGGGAANDWSLAANWAGGTFPNAAGDVARFNQAVDYTAPIVVNVSSAITVGEI